MDLGKIPVRWFPISWFLKDRKEYERFQGVIEDLPPSFTTDLMWTDGHLHELLSTQSDLKAFKIVQYEGNRRKLIGYFDSWVNLKISLSTEVRWEYLLLKWCKHALFSPNLKKKQSVNKLKKHKTPFQKFLVTGNKSEQKQASKKKGTPGRKSTNKKTKEKQPI